MKVLLKTLMLVLLGTLLILMIGSRAYGYDYVVNKGRYYCPVHTVIYEQAGSHQNCARRTVTVVPEYKYCSKCNTKYPANLMHSCPLPVRVVKRTTPVVQERKYVQPRYSSGYGSSYKAPFIDVNIWTTPGYGSRYYGRGRYGYVRNYYGYGRYGYGRTYYNLSGRNYFQKWFGDRHHHRDHHQPRRHRHRDHHRGYGGYRYGW